MTDFEKFKEKLPSKKNFTGNKISDKEYEHVVNVWNKFK